MKKKLFLGLLAAAAVSFTACQKDEVLNEVQQDNAIGFGTYVGRDAQTKATSIDEDGDLRGDERGFGVFAYFTAKGEWNGTSNTFDANFMKNQQVKYETDAWKYSPLKYWPKATNDKISFLAYYPYDSNTSLISTENADGTETKTTKISFNLNNNIRQQVDLMYVSNYADADVNNDPKNLNYNGTETKVSFNFAHALSRIGFKASYTVDQYTTITINEITLKFLSEGGIYKSGTLDIMTGEFVGTQKDDATFTWEKDLEQNSTNGKLRDDQSTYQSTSLNDDNSYLMIPPVGDAKYTITVDYEVKTEYGNEVVVVQNTYTTPSAGTITFEKGKAYTFNLNIGLTAISFNATVSPWTDADPQPNGITVQ